MSETSLNYGIGFNKLSDGFSFAIGITVDYDAHEAYLYINLFKLNIVIGKFYK